MKRASKSFMPQDSIFPIQGLDTDIPSTMLNPRYSPKSLNTTVTDGILSKRRGYRDFAETGGDIPITQPDAVGDPILGLVHFETLAGVSQFIAVTTRSRFLYNSTDEEWRILGRVVEDCETHGDWTASANVTTADESTLVKVGSESLKLTLADAFGTGLVCYDNFAAVNMIAETGMSFWFRSTVALDAGDWSVVLSEDADGAQNNWVEFEVPAIAANTWMLVRSLPTAGDLDMDEMNLTVSIGLYQNVDKGVHSVYFDDIRTSAIWTGDESNVLDYEVATDLSGRYLFIANGLDHPLFMDGTTEFFVQLAGPTGFETCKSIKVYKDHLVLGNVELAADYPKAIYWSVAGDFTDWSSYGSGTALLADAVGDIQKLLLLGDRLVVYAEDSIGVMTYVGGDVLYSFEQLVQNVRLLSPRSVVSIGTFHLVMTKEDVLLFDGSRGLRSMGREIRQSLRNEVDVDEAYKAFGMEFTEKHLVWWTIPLTVGTSKTYLFEYDITDPRNHRWVPLEYTDRPTAMGLYQRHDAITWNSTFLSTMSWSDWGMTWEDARSKKGAFVPTIGTSDGKVFYNDDTSLEDDGTTYEGSWESMDFAVPATFGSLYARWIEVELDVKGTAVDVYYSTNQGGSWTLGRSISLESSWTREKVFIDVVGKTIRFKVSSTTGHFSLRWLRSWFIEGGES